MLPTGCPETSVPNYHCTVRNITEERKSDLRRDGSLKSRTDIFYLIYFLSVPFLMQIYLEIGHDRFTPYIPSNYMYVGTQAPSRLHVVTSQKTEFSIQTGCSITVKKINSGTNHEGPEGE
jgi:hypothetical protein